MKEKILFTFIFTVSIYLIWSCTKLTDLLPRPDFLDNKNNSQVDNVKPDIFINSPTNNQVYNTNSVVVSGVASDEGSGVSEVWLKLNNGSYGKVSGTTSWISNLSGLSDGTNTIYVYAVDNAGNTSITQSVSFVVDTTSPIVSIGSPTNNQVINVDSVSVSGSASDGSGSGIKEVWLKLNSGSYGKVSGTTSWSSNLSGLSEGTNVVYVYAVDNAGNTSATQSVSFVVSTSVSVVVNNPTNNQVLNTNEVSVSGTASSYSGVNEVWLRLNNGSYGKVSGTTSWSSNLSGLSEGTNVVYVYAVDNAGNTSATQSVSFVISTSVSVVVNNPTNNQVLNTNEVSVSGTASSYSGVNEVWLKLNNGSYGKVSGTANWSTNLTGLSDGTNTIYVYAVDNAGNTSTTQSVSFVYMRGGIVFVSPSGDDANSGIFTSYPVKTINKGINIAVLSNWNKVYLVQGVYTPGNGLVNDGTNGVLITNNNIRLIGGWDTGFNNIVGYSELDGNNSLKHIIFATNVSNLVMSNLVVREGNANGSSPHDKGGGIYLSNVSYSLISNIILSNNTTSGSYGGGAYFEQLKTNVLYLLAISNKGYGGGLCLYQCLSNYVYVSSYSNDGGTKGGGIYVFYGSSHILNLDIAYNKASQGGGVELEGVNSTYLSGNIYYNNTTSGGGGGIEISSGSSITISANIYSNYSGWKGGAIYVFNNNGLKVINSIITNNRSNPAFFNSSIHLELIGTTKPFISNCYIGGDSSADSVGIYEETPLSGHTLVYNYFITNTLQYLYFETNTSSSRYITNTADDWTNINNPSVTGATIGSTNNTATNM